MKAAAAQYWIDDFGYLWYGPCRGGGNYRYKRFEGISRNGGEVWYWWLADPEPGWEQISFERAVKMIGLFREDAKKRG